MQHNGFARTTGKTCCAILNQQLAKCNTISSLKVKSELPPCHVIKYKAWLYYNVRVYWQRRYTVCIQASGLLVNWELSLKTGYYIRGSCILMRWLYGLDLENSLYDIIIGSVYQRDTLTLPRGVNLFCKFFAENCTKMKEFGLRRVQPLLCYCEDNRNRVK